MFRSKDDLLRKSRKPVLIVISSIILAVAIVSLTSGRIPAPKPSSSHLHNHLSISLGGSLLQIVCKYTLFPDVCAQELSSFQIPLTATPLDLVLIAVQAGMSSVSDARSLASKCSSQPGLNLFESQCAGDCVELMDDTSDQLNAAVSKLSTLGAVQDLTSLRSALKDVKVWLSSSLSYQTSCTDGFDVAPGSIQEQIASSQDYVAKVIANGLALVEILSQIGNDVGSWTGIVPPIPQIPHLRRLLSTSDQKPEDFGSHAGAFPEWVSAADRKLLQTPTSSVTANAVVDQNGTGNYLTIQDALNNITANYQGRYVIYIKQGVYAEVFNVSKDLKNLSFLGDGIGSTVITGDRNVASGEYNTYRTSTVGISGSGFLARGITFRNTAGPSGHQAVAVRAAADFLVFDRCSFEGYQDTLYALSSRQFYRDCLISGTVDFIFGNAIAVFQNCQLIARQPLSGQQNTYTAQGRKVSDDISGYSFQNCTVTADASLLNSSYSVSTYLGRPWKAYSRVVFIQSDLEAVVNAQGWLEWNSSNPFTDTLYYGEYQNRGPGSGTSQRVNWVGVHPNMSMNDASQFTVANFIAGETWLGSLQVTYDTGFV